VISFSKAGAEYRLVLELISSSANLIVTDETRNHTLCLLSGSNAGTFRHPLVPGLKYVAPAKSFILQFQREDAQSSGRRLPSPKWR
jgi:predicted ribosome quality control (RQC) complex YloA/Tae2 family protein